MRPGLVAAMGLAGSMAVAVSVHGQVDASRAEFPPDADVLYVPPPQQLRWMSLGYREALADLIWIRALIFTGANLGHTDIDFVERYVDAMNGLAPRFRRAYRWGAITAIYGGQGGVTRDMVERSLRIYRRGIEEFPESHELLYGAGMLLISQVGSTEGYTQAEKAAYAREGAEMIRKAAAFGADPLVRRYAATIVSDYATEALAIQFLESQLAAAEEDEHRWLLRKKLSLLVGGDRVDAIESVRAEFFEDLGLRRPYVPESVHAVIRSEVLAPPNAAAGTDDRDQE